MVAGTLKSAHLRHWPAAALLVLTGCSSLPTIVPDLARRPGPPVQLEGARGALSAAHSKAILDRLENRSQETGIFDHHLAREEAIVGSPLTAGNQVRLLQDGPATYQAMYAAIMAARDHINMETYILDDDEVGQRFAQALITKQGQGVQVNLIRDSVGTLGTPAAFFQQLTDSGVQVLEFNPINPLVSRKEWTLNQRDHRKLLIVDGHTAFLGGINISGVYSGGSFRFGSRAKPDEGAEPGLAWRDTDLQLQGPVVAEFQKLFLATWENQKGEPLPGKNYFPPPEHAGPHLVRAIGSSPDESFSLIYATLLSAIASAEVSVNITNAYFAPDPQLLDALEAAARRGVGVTLDSAEPDRFLAGVPCRTQLLRPAAASGGENPRAARRDPAFQDRADRRRLGHGRLDQPRLAQFPAQPRTERGGAGAGIWKTGAGDVRQGSRSVRRDHARAMAAPGARSAPHGMVRPGLGVLAVARTASSIVPLRPAAGLDD